MRAYLLRNIDPALWATVKATAAHTGHPLRYVILKLLELYSTGSVQLIGAIPGKAVIAEPPSKPPTPPTRPPLRW